MDEVTEPVVVKPKRKPAVRKPAVPKAPEPESPWVVLELNSDKDMQVEACTTAAFGKVGCLLRFRTNGKLTGQVQYIQNLQPKKHEGVMQLR